jgi:hypothetical protein
MRFVFISVSLDHDPPMLCRVTGKVKNWLPSWPVFMDRADAVINREVVFVETLITFQRTSYVACEPPVVQTTYRMA